jgi:hypothetical protein
VADCATCHGSTNEAWKSPAPRDHPLEQGAPARTWRAVCGACHDSAAAGAHIELETTPEGVEACAVCHGPGAQLAVDRVHRVR